MGTWNYRVVETDGLLGIHEVYYKGKKPIACTRNPVPFAGDSVDEIVTSLERALRNAKKLPVLTEKDFPKEKDGEDCRE